MRFKSLLGIFLVFLGVLFFYFRSSSSLEEEKNEKREVSIAWSSFPLSFDPRYATDADSQYLEDLIHCSLVTFDKNGKVIYELAKSVSWESATKLKIELQENFKFSDGTPVTKEDVKALYDFFLKSGEDPNIRPSPRALAFRNVSQVDILEESLVFHLKKPDASFLTNLVVGILPKKLSFNSLLEKSNSIPSCGAFYHKKSSLNEITLERNSHYPKGNKKAIFTVKIKIVKDNTTRFSKLRKGEVDIVQNGIDYQKVSSLKSYPGLKLLKEDALKTSYLGFNFKHPLLKKEPIRRAISLAINKDNIIKYILKDLASEASSLLPSKNFYSSGKGDRFSSYKPEEAQRIFDNEGLSLGKDKKYRFTLTLTLTNNPTRYAVAKSLVSDLAKVGVELKLKTLEWGNFKENVEKGLVDLWLLTWIGFKDPDIYRYAFSSESVPPNGGNRGWYENKELDLLLNKGLVTYKAEERKEIYLKIEEIVQRDKPYIFLYHEQNFAVARKNIEGFELYADGRYSSLKEVVKN